MKHFLLLMTVLLLSGCSTKEYAEQEEKFEYVEICKITEADLDIDVNNPKEIVFEEDQDIYVIEKAGDYILRGEWEGQIQIDVDDQIVHLMLDDVKLQSKKGPAVYVKSAAKVMITIPEGTESILMDGTDYSGYEDARACVFSADDLTINGSGSLQVYGQGKDAIRTKDVLKILAVDLDVRAKGTGLRGNDGVLIQTAIVDVQCEGTGIYTEKANKDKRGFVDIAGGTVNIIAGEYGIHAAQNVYVHDCEADVYGTLQDVRCSGEKYIEKGCLK